MSDFFGEVFSSEGFSAAYSKKLNPQTRDQRIAEFEARKASHVAAKAATLQEFLTGKKQPGQPEAAAQSPDANFPTRDEYRDLFASLTREQRTAASDALLDIELDRGELTDAPAAEYADEYRADDGDEWGVYE